MMKARLRIDELLDEREKSAYALANELGMGHGNLYKYRKGQIKAIGLEMIARFCEALECQPGDLIELVEDTPTGKKKSKAKG